MTWAQRYDGGMAATLPAADDRVTADDLFACLSQVRGMVLVAPHSPWVRYCYSRNTRVGEGAWRVTTVRNNAADGHEHFPSPDHAVAWLVVRTQGTAFLVVAVAR